MRKNFNIVIGIFLLEFGLIVKSLFNHIADYWVMIKYTSLFLFVFGLISLIFPLLTKWRNKPKKEFKQVPLQWTLYFGKNILLFAFMLLMVIGLEKSGKYLNYNLRNYYLASDSKITKGTITDIIKIDISKTGIESFYLIQFDNGKKLINGSLLVDYSNWDNNNQSKNFKIADNGILVNKIKGGKIDILYSEKFPSFIKIIE